jgi:hypothetical protein
MKHPTMSIPATISRDLSVQVLDLSGGGCQIETRSYMTVGTMGVLLLEIEGQRRLEWFRVCRVQAIHGRSGANRIGAEFLPVASPDFTSLRGAARSLGARQHRLSNV